MEVDFIKYMHLERFLTSAVEGIEDGKVQVFPKLDGTNASLWVDENRTLRGGSRNRLLSVESDNAGFYNAMLTSPKHYELAAAHPKYVFYGEWLVPHTLKTYREDAWRKFYIFDVFNRETGLFIPYDGYKPILEKYEVDYVPCIRIIKNGTPEMFTRILQENTFLVEDGKGFGEGIVLKDYDYKNQWGNTVFAKIVSNDFKAQNYTAMGAPVIGEDSVEEKIVEEFVTSHFVFKVRDKIINDKGSWTNDCIPRLMSTVWYDLLSEESYNFVKKYKNPKINFGFLNRLTLAKTKQLLPEIF